MENTLYQIAKELQIVMDEELNKNTVGTCYLSGHCLAIIFNKLGFESRKVTGKLAVLMKSGKNKYATYGSFPFKGKQVGLYHTWCEVLVNNETFIVDPSLKSNLSFNRKYFRVKTHPMVVNDTLVSNTPNTYYYKYQEDINLEPLSNESLRTLTTEKTRNDIIKNTLERIQILNIKKSA